MGLHRVFSFILGISNFMPSSLHNGQKPHSAENLSKSSRNADLYADMPKNQIPSQFLDIFEISQKCALSLPKSLHMAKNGFLLNSLMKSQGMIIQPKMGYTDISHIFRKSIFKLQKFSMSPHGNFFFKI